MSLLRPPSCPHVKFLFGWPPPPKQILESQVLQSFSLFPRIPILAKFEPDLTLNPSLLQFGCNENRELIKDFHVFRPTEVALYRPSAIRECKESAVLLMTINCAFSWL